MGGENAIAAAFHFYSSSAPFVGARELIQHRTRLANGGDEGSRGGQNPISPAMPRRDSLTRQSYAQAPEAAHHIEEDAMTLLTRRALALLPALAPFLSIGSARAAALNPAAVAFKLPDQIAWSPPSPAGSQNAVVVGDPTKEGLYLVFTKWLAGNHFSHPHFHPHDRFITVLKGTWWVGSGTKYDPDGTVPMPAGTFVTHYGQQVHFDGAKDEDAVLLIVGEGPGTSTPAEVK
jgi:quercetin dioxygenase-like cupin family protein